MTTTSPKRASARRDDDFWQAVRAAYVSGMPADRVARVFVIAPSTLMRRAHKEGWLRRDLARDAEAALTAAVSTLIPGAEPALRAAASPEALAALAPDVASIVPKALAAADAAVMRASEAAANADPAGAETASRLGERLARMANVLGRTKTPERLRTLFDDKETRRNTLLAQIDHALEGEREARRLEVEELTSRGIDPREAWVWDAADGVWVWNAGGALAKTAPLAPPADDQSAISRNDET